MSRQEPARAGAGAGGDQGPEVRHPGPRDHDAGRLGHDGQPKKMNGTTN